MTESIWLISVLPDEYSSAEPLCARRSLESAKRRCNEERELNQSDDYAIGGISWSIGEHQATGEAVLTYIIKGKKIETKQVYLLEEINLED